ncbi:MAG TPA: serine/threonine-protein kinase [Terriglobales bacterium]|nr:serine/threonine-protein kinase [Terriglobales bacterium]
MILTSGTKIGPYEIQSPLGAGGMGEVYRASDNRLGRDVAIKVLPEALARDAERLRRFETEARAVAALNHPNILSIHDIGTFNGAPYLVSECLEGHSLRQELSGGALPLRRAAEYAREIAQGLAAAHDKAIIHRDLKPENIFVTQDGRVKILDFGLAKLVTPEPNSSQGATIEAVPTSAGAVLGTVGYMSPEQVRGEPADARSDIFALGTILYEMVSGQRAFRRDTSAETMTAILKEDPPELSGSGKAISPAMERIVRRCLEKKPLQRFQSARDLAFNLEGISGVSSASAATVGEAVKPPRTWLTPVAIGAALLVVGGLAGWLMTRGAGTPTLPLYHQLTFERGLVYAARFAPDGRSIYYSASWSAQPLQIYSTDPASPESRSLGLTNSTLFAVSSTDLAISLGCDDRYIGNCQGTLGQVPISGGTPREIVKNALAADWTADASEMAVIRQVEGKYRVEFPRGKMIYENDNPLRFLRISPRGDAVAFATLVGVDGDAGWAMAVDRSGKQLLRSATYVSVEGLAWSPSGDEVWVGGTTHEAWANEIRAIGLNKKERVVLRLPGMLRLQDVSRDGRVLLTQESWRCGIEYRGPKDAKERDLSWLDYAELRDLSGDGVQVVFDDWGMAAGASGLAYVRKADGSPATKLGEWSIPVISPDNTQVLAFEALAVGTSRPALIPTGAGEVRFLNTTVALQSNAMGFMPDQKAVYFSNDDGHGWRMYVEDVTGGAPRAVTPVISVRTHYFETHVVSPDGKLIFARDIAGKGMIYPIAGGDARPVPGWLANDVWIMWSADGHSAFVYQDEKTSAPVYRLDLTTGKRDLAMTLAPSNSDGVTSIVSVRMAADGKTYGYSYTRELSDLFLVSGVH